MTDVAQRLDRIERMLGDLRDALHATDRNHGHQLAELLEILRFGPEPSTTPPPPPAVTTTAPPSSTPPPSPHVPHPWGNFSPA